MNQTGKPKHDTTKNDNRYAYAEVKGTGQRSFKLIEIIPSFTEVGLPTFSYSVPQIFIALLEEVAFNRRLLFHTLFWILVDSAYSSSSVVQKLNATSKFPENFPCHFLAVVP